MRTLLFLALVFTNLCMSPSPSQWIQIRTAYRTALSNNNHVNTFETACKSHSQTDAVAKAYYATALALRARRREGEPGGMPDHVVVGEHPGGGRADGSGLNRPNYKTLTSKSSRGPFKRRHNQSTPKPRNPIPALLL